MKRLKTLLMGLILILTFARRCEAQNDTPPAVQREFRGAWVASVANIDWPSSKTRTTAQQQAELIAILDKCVQLKLNCIALQVRPCCDALYASTIEPWSEFLTGLQGRAPSPYYDPLTFAVNEAHKRGIELHAWFNPYRASHTTESGPKAANHVSNRYPEIVRTYGSYLWLDPGEPATQDYTLSVIQDVVRRYDIDGVVFDDYFYPYKERDANNQIIPFPDDTSYSRYLQSGGTLARDDWRRSNVNQFVQRVYQRIKTEKNWVKFGIAPFGIWISGNPPGVVGLSAYYELYADSRYWLRNGLLDYFSPQLYWKISAPQQSYPALLDWWTDQNILNRHLWPSNFTSKVADGTSTQWTASEIIDQIGVTRSTPGATGNLHFSMRAFMQNRGSINNTLTASTYAQPALIPPSPWLSQTLPPRPIVAIERTLVYQQDHFVPQQRLTWKAADTALVSLWVVRARNGAAWTTRILPGTTTTQVITGDPAFANADRFAVSAVNRYGNESALVILNKTGKGFKIHRP